MENEPWIVGIIEKLMPTYGFINCQGRQTYFFQKGSVLTNPDSLRVGDLVRFKVGKSRKSKRVQAQYVCLLCHFLQNGHDGATFSWNHFAFKGIYKFVGTVASLPSTGINGATVGTIYASVLMNPTVVAFDWGDLRYPLERCIFSVGMEVEFIMNFESQTSSRAFLVTPILPIEQGYVKEVLEERKRVAIKPLSLENETVFQVDISEFTSTFACFDMVEYISAKLENGFTFYSRFRKATNQEMTMNVELHSGVIQSMPTECSNGSISVTRNGHKVLLSVPREQMESRVTLKAGDCVKFYAKPITMDTEEELIVFGVTIEPHFSLADEIGRMEAKILLVDKSFALCSPPESSMHYVFAKEEFLGNYADLRPGCMVTISVSETEPHRAVRVAMKTEAMQCISNGTEQSESRDNSQPNKQLSGKSSDTTKIVTEKNDLKSFAQSSEIKPIARAPLTGYAEALYKKPTGEAQDNNNNINGSSANMNSTGTRIPPVLRKTVGY